MFGRDGYLVDDSDVRCPGSRFYQLFDCGLLGDSESEEGIDVTRDLMRGFLKSTWRSNSGDHRAEA